MVPDNVLNKVRSNLYHTDAPLTPHLVYDSYDDKSGGSLAHAQAVRQAPCRNYVYDLLVLPHQSLAIPLPALEADWPSVHE